MRDKRGSEYLAVAKAFPKKNDFCNKCRVRHHHGNWPEHGFKIVRKLCAASIAWKTAPRIQNPWKSKQKCWSLSHVQLFETLWTLWNPVRLLCPWDSQATILEWVAIPFFRGHCFPKTYFPINPILPILCFILSPLPSSNSCSLVSALVFPTSLCSSFLPQALSLFAARPCFRLKLQSCLVPISPSFMDWVDQKVCSGLFIKMLWKNLNELCGWPNITHSVLIEIAAVSLILLVRKPFPVFSLILPTELFLGNSDERP